MKNLVKIFGLSGLLLMPAMALAQDDDPFGFPGEEEEEPEVVLYNFATLKVGDVSYDNFTFSKYQDFRDEGVFVTGDLSYAATNSANTTSWTLDISDLGLETQDLKFAYLTSGNLRVKLNYSESPIARNNSGITPFLGDETLVLPSTWVTGIDSGDFSLSQFTRAIDNEVLRRSLEFIVDKKFDMGLRLAATATLEDKSGTMVKGVAIYSNAANPQAVMLPTPVDQKTTEFTLKAGYDGKRLVVDARGVLTSFENRVDLVTWQNPYNNGLGAAVDYPAGIGGYAPAPDYDMLSYTIASGYRFNDWLRVTLDAMTSKTEQQEPLQAYTANPLLAVTAGLPTDRLSGDLITDMLNVAVLTKPLDRLSVNLKYRFNQRENREKRYAWQYVRGDGADQPSADFALFNRPLDLQKDLYTLEGKYRLKNRTRLGFSYDYAKTLRNFASVEETEEDTYTFTVEPAASEHFKHRIEVSLSDLGGSTYEWSRSFFLELTVNLINQIPDDQRWTNHPLLRQYHLANQEKTTFKWTTSYFPNDDWMLQAAFSGKDVAFDKSELGLTRVNAFGVNVSAHFTGSETYSSWIWVDYNDDSRRQVGRDFLGGLDKPANRVTPPLPQGSDPARNYEIEQDGASISTGMGMDWQISDRWSVKTALAYLWADEAYEVTTFGALDLAGTDFPASRYRMYSLTTGIDYELENGMLLTFEHRYFRYTDGNWQYDDLVIGEVAKVLTTGMNNPNEVVNMFTLAMSYRF